LKSNVVKLLFYCISPSVFVLKTDVCGKTFFSFAGGELFMQLEREGIFMEDTAW